MPLYDYRCNSCNRRFTALVGVVAGSVLPECPTCGSNELTKLISLFSVTKPEEDAIDNLLHSSDLEDNPQIDRVMSEMKSELGEDFEKALEYGSGSEPSGDWGGEDKSTTPDY
jgi:putative FmdB family regulatory protein